MTVSYQYDVASSSTGGFFRLLWRWRGSIWKLLYKELLLFSAVYLSIAFSYDFLMTDYYKRYYERIVIFCSAFVEIIPLSFILGFYVSFTATRWWQQYTAIPWPDKLMNIIALYVPGNDVTSRVLRRTLMRYLNLTLVLVLRSISIPVKRRFPTKEHLVEAGFMSRPELEMYSSVPSHEFNTFWIPCTWFVNLLREAKSECRITDSGGIKLIMEEFNEFRSKCGLLWSYDWVSIPLVYTQVVTLSTQAFFLASLLGRQHINPPKDQDVKSHIYGEYYIPVFTLLQFILYMGLLKLGEQLINPFGDDDEDFELNWIIDRHLKVSFLGVDILNSDPPPLIKDNYFDEMDIKLPYTEAAVAHKVKTYRGSVAAFHVPSDKHGLVIPEFDDDNGEEEDDSTIHSVREREPNNARASSWTIFGKRKLSSSIDSFNSETMVERGLEETEMPTLQPNSSWSSFLMSERSAVKGKGSVSKPEGTQGIGGSTHSDRSALPKDAKMLTSAQAWKPVQAESGTLRTAAESELVKQSSFSTSDSSIVIPMGEEADRRTGAHPAAKYFGFRKSPLQVFSKEYVNAPMSAFKVPHEQSHRNSGDRSSLSSLSLKSEKPAKQPKSLMKCHRAIDPKLRIRPFRSKVTFSEDTKTGDSSKASRAECMSKYTYPSRWDSSSDSVASMLRGGEEPISLKRQHTFAHSTSNVDTSRHSALKLQDIPFADSSKRRQSLDPALYMKMTMESTETPKMEELTKDNWLHYQSLPNIQEEDQQQTSPTETSAPNNFALNLPQGTNSSPFPVTVTLVQPQTSPTLGSLLVPQSPFDQTWQGRRRSIKRQKSQDLTDEDMLKASKLPPPPAPNLSSIAHLRKQSSSESQTSNNSTSSNQLKSVPPGILRRPKEDLKPRQASTESDTASYHTVNSFLMQVEKSNSSSIDSFTSAVSESNTQLPQPNNQTQPPRAEMDPIIEQTVSPSAHYLSSCSLGHPVESSSLVPKITFSQSTPSVTSQSSDDQSSPKWDQKYPAEFSSIETVMDASYRPSNNPPVALPKAPSPEDVLARATPAISPSTSSFSSQLSSLPSHVRPQPSESLHLTIQDVEEETQLSGETNLPRQNTAFLTNNSRSNNHSNNNHKSHSSGGGTSH